MSSNQQSLVGSDAMDSPIDQEIYSVSQLNAEVGQLLEQAFPFVWVEGEISNLARPQSGHVYFTLKDHAAQVRCALFRNRAMRLRHTPENGDRVRIRARIGLYAPRGEYQLIAEHMEPAGAGDLQRAFEALQKKLGEEGLFATAHKKPIPALPRRIGVITSPTGAAIRDVLSVLERRYPAMAVLIYPVRVQGDGAAAEIAQMIALADARAEVDVLLVTRGGGSLEDLWAFNEEIVARAIFAASLPVVSAIGHEVDIAISDLVADERAATPSAAAERLSPDTDALRQGFQSGQSRLLAGLQRDFSVRHTRVTELLQRLHSQHPGRQLQERAQRLDELEQRLTHAAQRRLQTHQTAFTNLNWRLLQIRPAQKIAALKATQTELTRRLHSRMQALLSEYQARIKATSRALDAVSPLATLHRGYAIVRRPETGEILRNSQNIKVGEQIEARLDQGILTARVENQRATDE